MRLLADLHTHSIASGHAYSTIKDLACGARERGLELIAVTDHGPALSGAPDLQYFGNLRVLPRRIEGVAVLTGVEANTADTPSGLDLPDKLLVSLDVVAVGLHPVEGVDVDDAERNTAALVRALSNPLVDVLTHAGRSPWLIDVEAVVQAASRAGVAVEVNNHSFGAVRRGHGADQELRFIKVAVAAGLRFSIASDAHHEARVGVFDDALRVAAEVGLPEESIVNRDSASVTEFLLSRRPRPHVDGKWEA